MSLSSIATPKVEFQLQNLNFDNIMNIEFHSVINPCNVEVLIDGVRFVKSLGLNNPRKVLLEALNDNIDLFLTWGEFVDYIDFFGLGPIFNKPKNWKPQTILINEAGVKTFLSKCYDELHFAIELEEWICQTVFPCICNNIKYITRTERNIHTTFSGASQNQV